MLDRSYQYYTCKTFNANYLRFYARGSNVNLPCKICLVDEKNSLLLKTTSLKTNIRELNKEVKSKMNNYNFF